MSTTSYQTTIGCNDIEHFIGDCEYRIQFSEEEMNALILAQVHSQNLADVFVNHCTMTFAFSEIPSCFPQDLSPDEVRETKEELPAFQNNFRNAFFNFMLIFEH